METKLRMLEEGLQVNIHPDTLKATLRNNSNDTRTSGTTITRKQKWEVN